MAIGFSRDGITLDANRAYLRLFGYERVADLRGTSLLEQIAPSARAEVQGTISARARGDRPPERYQTRGRKRDGTEFAMDVVTTRVLVGDSPLTIAFITDASEREDRIGALQASEERFRTLSSAAFEGVFVSHEGQVLFANEAVAAMYGCDPAALVGVPLMELIAPESREVVAEYLRRDGTEPYEMIALRRDGSTFFTEVRGRTLVHQGQRTRVAVVRDLTEQKRREAEQRAWMERVQQTQKLEGLGVLAGGVAHDFNNILTVISNEVALAQREAGVGASTAAHLDAVALAAARAADLCRQMLAYAGKARLERETVELTALVDEMASMLEASISKSRTLVRELTSGIPPIWGDATQIRQVVMNLVLNASEAIPGPQGTIRVTTGAGVYEPAAFARSVGGAAAKGGRYAWLEVRDDGVGMDAATVAQMFDPFFTTKQMGRGLGMAAVLGIVRGHEGAIEVESSPGRGTRVRVFFPVCAKAAAAAAAAPAEGLRGEGVVLLVDDEKNVRISTEHLLRGFGFEVAVASGGAEALEVLRSGSRRIDAVLLDLSMPGMDGIETLKQLRQLAPGTPVVLSSGYGSVPLEEKPDALLPKPYVADRLLATLLAVIRRR